MPNAKIHLKGHLSVDRANDEPLSLQVAAHVQRAIHTGDLPRGARLPSSRALAIALRVSRNTILAAYDELAGRGIIRGRRGSGMYVCALPVRGFSMRAVLRDAQFPGRSAVCADPDSNQLRIVW